MHRELWFAYFASCFVSGFAAVPIALGIYDLHGLPWSALYLAFPLIVAAAITVPFMLVGLPIHALLHKHKAHSIFWYAGSGIVIGATPVVLLTLLQGAITGRIDYDEQLKAGEFGMGLGLVASSTFWLIRRPDRNTASQSKDSGS